MATELARQRAAQVWCKETTSSKVMDVELAEAFAEIIDEIWTGMGLPCNEEVKHIC